MKDDSSNLAAIDRDGDLGDAEQDQSSLMPFEAMQSSPRKTYQFFQRIAPVYNRSLPSEANYFNVECNDISRGGISFYLKRPPGCKYFAIVLGQGPSSTIMFGRVVNSKEVNHDNHRMYLVGCQFIDRLM
jgi:hypothetical protein